MEYWIEVSICVPYENLDAVSDIVREVTGNGIIEERELAACPEGIVVKGYFQARAHSGQIIRTLQQEITSTTGVKTPLTVAEVATRDWTECYRQTHKILRVGKRFVLKPFWEEYAPGQGELVIEFAPTLAFGCGTHPTTEACLEYLEEYLVPGSTVYDVGTGSGILAIAAALLGAGDVLAVDIDPVAVEGASLSIAQNNLSDIVRVVEGSLLDGVQGRCDLMTANILAEILYELFPSAIEKLVPGGLLIASGIMETKEKEVTEAMLSAGFLLFERTSRRGWSTLVGRKTGSSVDSSTCK